MERLQCMTTEMRRMQASEVSFSEIRLCDSGMHVQDVKTVSNPGESANLTNHDASRHDLQAAPEIRVSVWQVKPQYLASCAVLVERQRKALITGMCPTRRTRQSSGDPLHPFILLATILLYVPGPSSSAMLVLASISPPSSDRSHRAAPLAIA